MFRVTFLVTLEIRTLKMKKTTSILAATAVVFGLFIPASPASANTTNQAAYDVSAYYRVDLGYKVGWKTPADRSGITGYVVTAQPTGQTCVVRGWTAKECTFSTRTLGFTNTYTFTVSTMKNAVVAAVSAGSNSVTAASIPLAPRALVSEVVSPTRVDVAWVPNSNTGGAPLYGYKLTYWKSDTKGSPINSTKVEQILSSTATSLTVEPGFMYIINLAACNAYGCSSADYWSYANTGATNVTLPRLILGGNASTTCFDSIYDANTGESSTGTSCGSITIDPSTYPVIDPSATTLNINLPTKFAQRATLSFSRTYSLSTWGPIGISWFANLNATSKSVALGFEATPVITSTTPSVCEVVGPRVILKTVGTCSIQAYVEENGVFERSNTVIQNIGIN